MGEENRGSSGGNTALIVIGIVAVVLLIPCCGVVALFGTGFFMARSAVQDVQMEMIKAQEEVKQANQEMMMKNNEEFEKTRDQIEKEIEGIKIPESETIPEAPGGSADPFGSEEKKE
jgi:hypothetical protein